MTWRERVRQEVLAVLKEHDVFSTMDEVARDIADALPSPDERNGYVIVPIEPTPEMVERMAKGIELANNNCRGMKFSDLLRSMACMAYMEAVRMHDPLSGTADGTQTGIRPPRTGAPFRDTDTLLGK